MTLNPGIRVGGYQIVSLLGEGGMDEVYRAHDTNLRRDVALKILPALFAADPDRRARFTREAHVLAALDRNTEGNEDIWLMDTARGALTRFTADPASDRDALWSPDGLRLVSGSTRGTGMFNVYQKSADGTGSEEPLLITPFNQTPLGFSPDGQLLLFRSFDPKTGFDLWGLPLSGDRKPFPIVQTSFDEREGGISPDGRWLAFQSNESGRFEIYVQPFPGPGAKVPVSTEGGAQALGTRREGAVLHRTGRPLDGCTFPTRRKPKPTSVGTDRPVRNSDCRRTSEPGRSMAVSSIGRWPAVPCEYST